ncbi:MAG TPA: UGSC family (seleno)protein [Candidatus Baltobacteraceae bacterium]|nr:UGSC family (seleno)protein [Candidatus Baltobacteraceae bacterium]
MPLVTARFADFVERDARTRGTPLRFGFPPYPVVGMSRAVLRQYIEGNDPITVKPLMEEVIEGLTSPLTEGEKHPTPAPRKPQRPRLLAADSAENLHRQFMENGWTDGLPIVLPTENRVAEMLAGTDHAPDEIVGRMCVTTHQERLEYTVEKVAAIAVMAGARPEHFPVILALAASQEPSMPSSTTSWGRMMIVNGPIRNEIGMNCGVAALSPFNFANSVIGRAWTLMSINFGDARAGENFMATFGHSLNYNNMCCGENEEMSVFEPFHVQKGFRPDESVVSLFRGWNVLNFGIGVAKEMAHVISTFGSMGTSVTFVVDPLVAKNLRAEGFRTKQEACKWIVENSTLPAGHYWKGEMQAGFAAGLAKQGIEPFASLAKLPKDAPIAPRHSPNDINIVVVGGETNPMWITTDFAHTQSVSIDKWRPKGGLKRDAKPLRMPEPVICKDGLCGIPETAPNAEPVTAAD